MSHGNLQESRANHNAMNADELQRMAANPNDSIWVAASAGTGKTKVLTDRVLRLLLPRNDGRDGTPPRKILCLTYTKAAANEMAQRIHKTLGAWAVMDIAHDDPKKSLHQQLRSLIGFEPTQAQIAAAQSLFARVIDCPTGLQIMTIHSFCKSVLSRFPVEAGLPPDFDLIQDSDVLALMKQAQNEVLQRATSPENAASPLADAVQELARVSDEDSFSKVMSSICQERHQLLTLFEQFGDTDRLYVALCEYFDIPQDMTEERAVKDFCAELGYFEPDLRRVAQAMIDEGGATSVQQGAALLTWLNIPDAEKPQHFDLCRAAFLVSNESKVRSRSFPPADVIKADPTAEGILQQEGERVLAVLDILKRILCARMSRDIIVIGFEVLKAYTRLKQQRGVLDYDDLILKTIALLSGQTEKFAALGDAAREMSAQWIMYKLDQGLDHVLVDEAQDTNPEQWQIVETLWDEFFSGQGAREDVLRTSFVVGDVKQSIYSFQRAAPKAFRTMEGKLSHKVRQAEQVFEPVGLHTSFRTTDAVLRVVDAVFSDPQLNEAVGGGEIEHTAHRAGQAGLVELWPVFETPKADKREYWTPPTEIVEKPTGAAQLADYITQQIAGWLKRGDSLESHDRPIDAGDIMILVRSRSGFVDLLVRNLKTAGIPVSGVDRMVLADQIVVQDMLAMASFCLMPDDDLMLASVLKSPLFGWSEEDIFALSYNRKGTLWQELCNFDAARLPQDAPSTIDAQKRDGARDYLSRLMGRVSYMGAYEFFSHILNRPCPADAHSGLRAIKTRLGEDAMDPLDEFLNAALSFPYDSPDHLQLFVREQSKADTEIKRELEEGGGKVRIMTIHASKGLQAPIVILPDTIKSSGGNKRSRLLWPNKTGLNLPLFAPRSDDEAKAYSEAMDRCKALEEEEYYRLLYVAMTRAEDRLYIAGHKGANSPPEGSWYYTLRAVLEQHEDAQRIDGDVVRVSSPQTAPPDRVKDMRSRDAQSTPLPSWALRSAPAEAVPPRPLLPSRPSEDEQAPVASPLVAAQEYRFRRGNITHKLLQFLPDFDEAVREDAAHKFVQKTAVDLSETVQRSIVDEVMKILNVPEYAPFFRKGSLAEVSVTGLMEDNRIVSGQIDRLVIGDGEIWIVDYKTNRPPPRDPKDVPQIYYKQLRAYRDSIAEIYPNHVIHCALLWTDGPNLMLMDV